MEGVLVTAKKTNSTIAITVVTDAQGRYRFPSAKLEPGHYAISIRAVATTRMVPPQLISARSKPPRRI